MWTDSSEETDAHQVVVMEEMNREKHNTHQEKKFQELNERIGRLEMQFVATRSSPESQQIEFERVLLSKERLCNSLEEEKTRIKAENRQLKQRIQGLHTQQEGLEKILSKVQERCHWLDTQLLVYQEDLKTERSDRETAESRSTELETQVADLQRQLASNDSVGRPATMSDAASAAPITDASGANDVQSAGETEMQEKKQHSKRKTTRKTSAKNKIEARAQKVSQPVRGSHEKQKKKVLRRTVAPEEIRVFKCLSCVKTFSKKDHLDTHMRIHTGEKPFRCATCSKSFARADSLRYHSGIHLDPRSRHMVACDTCNKKFTHKSNLNLHMRRHTGIKSYACRICEKLFWRLSDRNRHLLTHNDKPFICFTCGQKFARSYEKKLHCSQMNHFS